MHAGGKATFFSATSSGGNCSFGSLTNRFFAAINSAQYENSAACGKCARVTFNGRTTTVRIVD